jgi:hypothetical protein
MSDIFISYSSHDRSTADTLARGLNEFGWSVWWDRSIPTGKDFGKIIEAALKDSKVTIVLWSEYSVGSRWVLTEADAAADRGILVPILIDPNVEVPFAFRRIQAADLSEWDGNIEAPSFRSLVADITDRIGPGRAAAEGGERPQPKSQARGSLFLCYRRGDTEDAAGRLHDRLVDAYGTESVFMDIDSVPLGIDFVDHVTDQIARCSTVIVMIGRQWLKIQDDRQRRRLDNEDYLVRAEVRAALQRKIPVIPVVVQNASMPGADELPEDIRLLARRNGISLRPDQWKEGVERLLRELDAVMGRRSKG